MWALTNRTAYAAERNWTRDAAGIHFWIVAVKATFDIAPSGRLRLADEQSQPLLAPEYFADPATSSLRYDSDLLAIKPTTDINVVARAYAPGGKPVSMVPVSLRAGQLEKRLRVYGERNYENGLVTSPRPFTSQPLMYEFAFGGRDISDPDPLRHRIDQRNPVGRGFAIHRADREGQLAHAIEYSHGNPAEHGPAGFGPIDASWLPRRTLAGTYDAAWEASKKPLLPDDYQPAFAQSAPADQRPDEPLEGGERVELSNVTPEGLLYFELPRVVLEFTTRIARRRESRSAALTTLLVEPEERRVALVWQSVLRVPAPDTEYLDYTEIVERKSGL